MSGSLPRRRRAWASWNFHAPRPELSEDPVSLTYLINRLQPLPFAAPVMLSMNPIEKPRAERVLASFEYHHPVFLEGSDEAKRRVGSLQGRSQHVVLRRVDATRAARGRARFRDQRRSPDGCRHPLGRMSATGVLSRRCVQEGRDDFDSRRYRRPPTGSPRSVRMVSADEWTTSRPLPAARART